MTNAPLLPSRHRRTSDASKPIHTLLATAFAMSIASALAAHAETQPRPADDLPSVRLVRVWPDAKLRRPTQILARPDRDGAYVVLEQSGRIV